MGTLDGSNIVPTAGTPSGTEASRRAGKASAAGTPMMAAAATTILKS